jgi:hypothetical protein
MLFWINRCKLLYLHVFKLLFFFIEKTHSSGLSITLVLFGGLNFLIIETYANLSYQAKPSPNLLITRINKRIVHGTQMCHTLPGVCRNRINTGILDSIPLLTVLLHTSPLQTLATFLINI